MNAADDDGLVHASDTEPGIRRRRHGNNFRYLDANGRPVRDPATLARIRSLAIPPAYTDVWICPDPRGHLQATGRDARGRKQYRYHPRWQAVRGERKYDRMLAFARDLPRLRAQVRKDLALPGFPREKVIALVVAVMGQTLIRIGNENYVRENRSYGLTTLRNQHAEFLRSGQVRFRFRGKGGKPVEAEVRDGMLARLVKRCQQLPGQTLFQYHDTDGGLHQVSSGDVNAYLREVMGAEYSAKDFRTWGATLTAFRALAGIEVPDSESGCSALRQQVLKATAAQLGNTVRICEKCYVDPAVFAAWESRTLARYAANARGPRQWEAAALRCLRRMHRASGG